MSSLDELLALTLAAHSAAEAGNIDEVNAILGRRAEVLHNLESSGAQPTAYDTGRVKAAEQGLRAKLEQMRALLVADSGDARKARQAAMAYQASK